MQVDIEKEAGPGAGGGRQHGRLQPRRYVGQLEGRLQQQVVPALVGRARAGAWGVLFVKKLGVGIFH